MSTPANQAENVVVTPLGRVLFPNLFEARAVRIKGVETGDPKYSLTLLFDTSDPDVKAGVKRLTDAAIGLAKNEWPGRDLKELHFPFANGDKEAAKREKGGKDGSFYDGMYVLKTSSKFAPQVVDEHGQPIIDKAKVYSGCWGYAEVTFKTFEVGSNKPGITAYVNFFMKKKGGDRIAQKHATDVFAEVMSKDTGADPTPGDDLDDDEIPF